MKNCLKALLSVILVFVLFSCGNKEVDLSEVNVELTVVAEKKWMDYYTEAANRLNEKYKNVKIDVREGLAFDVLELIDKTDPSNSDVPDIYIYPLDRFSTLVQKDALASIDAMAIAKDINATDAVKYGLGKNLMVENDYLGFPMNIETLVTAINTGNASKRGLDLNTESIEISNLKELELLMPVFNTWWGVALTNAVDLELLGEKDGVFYSDLVKNYEELNTEQQKLFEFLYKYWQEAEKNRVSLFDIKSAYGYVDKEFSNDGIGVLRVAGPWEMSGFDSLIGNNLEIKDLNFLTIANKPLKHWKGGWAFGINVRNDEDKVKKEIAEEYIKELMNPKYADELYKVSGKIMPNATIEDYTNSNLPELDKNVIVSVIKSYNDAVERPLFKEWGLVWDTWQNGIISWNSQKPKDVKEAYQLLQNSFKSLLENIK